MSLYVEGNLILEKEKQLVIFNVPSSRVFTVNNTEHDLSEVLSQINEKCVEKIESRKLPTEDNLRQLVISCAETCNLSCKYCFASAGTYNRDEKKKIIDEEGYENLLKIILELDHPINTICFFGGEPLLGFVDLKKFVEKLMDGYKERDWGKPNFGIVTNGTLINEEVAAFFSKYQIRVTISIDGEKEVNDKNRYYGDKSKSVYDTIVHNMQYMKNRNHYLSAAATMSREVLRKFKPGDYEKSMKHFLGLGFDYMQLILADEKEELTDTDKAQVRLFIKEELDYVFNNILEGTNLYSLPRGPLGVISTIVKRKYSVECPAGKILKYYTVNGQFYPCQLYFAVDRKEANLLSRTQNSHCKDCFCVNICSEYCPGGSVWANGKEDSVIDIRCYVQKETTKEVLRRINDLMGNKEFIERVIEMSRQYKQVDNGMVS